jgi:hypothetical protein
VILPRGFHPFPSRTRKLSPAGPIVLHAKVCGRVGRCRQYKGQSEKSDWPFPFPGRGMTGAFSFLRQGITGRWISVEGHGFSRVVKRRLGRGLQPPGPAALRPQPCHFDTRAKRTKRTRKHLSSRASTELKPRRADCTERESVRESLRQAQGRPFDKLRTKSGRCRHIKAILRNQIGLFVFPAGYDWPIDLRGRARPQPCRKTPCPTRAVATLPADPFGSVYEIEMAVAA